MDVAFYDPFKADGWDKSLGIRPVESLGELLEQSFVVSLHCPTHAANIHGRRATIEQMPIGSFLINTARGAIVDTTAIPEAIRSGRLAGRRLDVLPHEPPGEDDP